MSYLLIEKNNAHENHKLFLIHFVENAVAVNRRKTNRTHIVIYSHNARARVYIQQLLPGVCAHGAARCSVLRNATKNNSKTEIIIIS